MTDVPISSAPDKAKSAGGYGVLLAVAIAAPLLFPAFVTQFTFLWILIVISLCWNIMGGEMGYNSFGNIVFFGVGMYTASVVQVGLYTDVAEYTAAKGGAALDLTVTEYLVGMGLGVGAGALLSVVVAGILGLGMLGLRGHYFAIGTLGLGIAAGQLAAAWGYIGAGSGMVPPKVPEGLNSGLLLYFMAFVLAIITFFALKRLYRGRFGLALNAIRDDEDKAEAMGLHTTLYKTVAWCVSAFFTAMAGAITGYVVGFIDPIWVAFSGVTYGVWMVLMTVLGGKGTLWGPVIGAAVFHVTQELFWTYLLGWQRVALGLLIVLIVVFFPKGIVGYVRDKFPERFGYKVDPEAGAASADPALARSGRSGGGE
jgi:branched-chain amino acid transport system permease protein